MRYVLYAIYVYFIISLNAGLFPAISLFGAIPQLMILTCVVLAVTEDDMHILFFVSLLGGFFWELYTGLFPGSLMLGYMFATGIIYTLSRRVFFLQDRVKYLPLFLVIFNAFVVVWTLSLNVLAVRIGIYNIPLQLPAYFSRSLFSFLYNLVLLYPIYILLAQVQRISDIFDRQRHALK